VNLNKLSEDFSRIANSTSGLPDYIAFYVEGLGCVEMSDTLICINDVPATSEQFVAITEYLERSRDDSKSAG